MIYIGNFFIVSYIDFRESLYQSMNFTVFSSRSAQFWLFGNACDVWSRSFPALRFVSCNFDQPPRSSENWQPSTHTISQTIKSLFGIKLITQLSLTFAPSQFTVSDQDINDIASAWPCLTTLELGVDPSLYMFMPQDPAQPGTGETALSCLAVRCPLLQILRLDRLDMRDVHTETIEECVGRIPTHRRLEHLLFGRVRVDGGDYGKGARVVDHLFPNLRVPPEWEQIRGVRMFWDAISSCKAEREERAGVSTELPTTV
ncbi:hypothetical protein C8Q76DRAFT_758307 [Earliella scabrosa]|nr:hypothetical protein C8Q76DRAFT_758307 [Earliella scabrosa]